MGRSLWFAGIMVLLVGCSDMTDWQKYNDAGWEKNENEEFQEALRLYEIAYEKIHFGFSIDREGLAILTTNMAATYRALGDFENARKYYEESLKAWEELVGREHANFGVIAGNYSLFLESQGDYEQALDYANESLAIRRKIYGENHQETVISHEILSGIHLNSGNYELAIEHGESALASAVSVFGKHSESVASAEVTLGSAYREAENYEKAQEHIAVAAELYTRFSPDSTRAADTINELALIQQARGEYNLAHVNFKRALSTYLTIYGDNHPFVSIMHDNIAWNYVDWGRYEDALSEIIRSVEIKRSVYGPTHKLTKENVEDCIRIAELGDSPSEVCGISSVRGRLQ